VKAGPARRVSSTHRSCGTTGSGRASSAHQRRPPDFSGSRTAGSPVQRVQVKKKSTRSSTGLPLPWVRCIVVSGTSAAGSMATPISSAASRHAAAVTDSPCSTWPAAAVAQCPSR
jgi:hypothetical protein